jgi:dihydrofolate synthase/folylpolyglutamate synthase
MTYHNAVKYVKNAPNLTPKNSAVSDRISVLSKALGNPQRHIKYIRLAGSNGKTICARMLTSILNEASISSGCFSMPIHEEIRDNIRINGEPISMDEAVVYISAVRDAVVKINADEESGFEGRFAPTAHEILLFAAILAFNAHKCSVCIIEGDHTGEDPSRFLAVSPFSAIICGIIPSSNKKEILRIRSYISRGMREIVAAPQDEKAFSIIQETCASAGCRPTQANVSGINITRLALGGTDFTYKDNSYSLQVCGKFQTANAIIAIESANMLKRCGYKIEQDHITNGLALVKAPCKFEIISAFPTIIADSTYAPVAIEAICDSLADFKSITGTHIRLCLPDGELIPQYITALRERAYTIDKISALIIEGVGEEERGECDVPFTLSKTYKLAAKDALSGLDGSSILLISGPSNFTEALRHQLLSILGF